MAENKVLRLEKWKKKIQIGKPGILLNRNKKVWCDSWRRGAEFLPNSVDRGAVDWTIQSTKGGQLETP